VLAEKHFIKARSTDWTRFWSNECVKDYEALAVMEQVITSGRGWRNILGKKRAPDYELALKDRQWARDFTYALYDIDKPMAEILAKNLDLSEYRSLLDIGGGSGVMSIALARANPNIMACILDFKYVCEAAKKIIRKERMSRRIKTLTGDMNKTIPRGFDVIMFWNIGHIDTRVMKMAYESLPEGGMIVRECTPPARTNKPSPTRFIHGYMSVRPKGQTRDSISQSLKETGFKSAKYRKISPGLGLITGRK
jgi:cyclopropane fatty-acyl-phospholipid synthase-like methyltransferase